MHMNSCMRYFAAFIAALIASAESLPPNTTLVYVGTHTMGGKSKGIYVYRLQTSGMEVSQNIRLLHSGWPRRPSTRVTSNSTSNGECSSL